MPQPDENTAPGRSARPRWVFDSDVPTHEYFSLDSLDEMWNLQEAVAGFVYELEQGRLQLWEAVACQEQGLPLTARQHAALNDLVSFGDDDEDEDDGEGCILQIDGIERPSVSWDVMLNKIVTHLLTEPFRTAEVMHEVNCEGFSQLMDALREHGQELSLPPGIPSPEEVIPAELRHKLWLQLCFDALGGLGQEPELNLKEQPDRIDWFIDRLREHKDSVRFLGLGLESLMKRVILPTCDQPLFVEMMQMQLALRSIQESIADRL